MFDRFERKNHSGENRKAVFGSPIIAKAILTNERGETFILAVFQKSTRLEFYWVFRAKSQRASRRSWRPVTHYPRDFPFARKHYNDFGSFVEYYVILPGLTVLSQRVMHKRRLSALLIKTEHESILGDWTPQDPRTVQTDLCRVRAQRARSRYAWR